MGTDIYSKFQSQTILNDGEVKWNYISSDYDKNRHYLLFAVLAGVRNGYGFAGAYRHEPLNPISEPRGLPDGVDDIGFGWSDQSWLLGSEMLEWYRQDRMIVQGGILTAADFARWDKKSKPDSYHSMMMGKDVRLTIDMTSFQEMFNDKDVLPVPYLVDDWTHIQVYWRVALRDELAYFFEGIITPLMNEYGEIRMVFGFD